MKTRSICISGGAAIAVALAFAGPASAGTSRCYDSFGAPVGPVFDNAAPNYHWIQWVQTRGGACRAMTPQEAALYDARILDYPPEYRATLSPGAPPSVPGTLQSQPPTTATSVWLGDTARAAELLTVSYAQRGHATSSVADTGRVIYRPDGVWRIYNVSWDNGHRRQIAVNMRPGGSYFAIESEAGESWSDAVPIGR